MVEGKSNLEVTITTTDKENHNALAQAKAAHFVGLLELIALEHDPNTLALRHQTLNNEFADTLQNLAFQKGHLSDPNITIAESLGQLLNNPRL